MAEKKVSTSFQVLQVPESWWKNTTAVCFSNHTRTGFLVSLSYTFNGPMFQ